MPENKQVLKKWWELLKGLRSSLGGLSLTTPGTMGYESLNRGKIHEPILVLKYKWLKGGKGMTMLGSHHFAPIIVIRDSRNQ